MEDSPPVVAGFREEEGSPVVAEGSVEAELQVVGRVGADEDSMKDRMKRLLTEADRHRVETCVREAESRTRGEIVVMVVPASYHYPMASLLGATAFSFPVAIALTPAVGGLFWVGPHNLWVFLAVLIPLFLVFHEVVKGVHILKRCFIRGKEMEEEVQEASGIQFFHKGLYRTREETGVLIYISVFERKVCVLGDRGINAVIPQAQWNGIAATIAQAIKKGEAAEGICQAVDEVGRILQRSFPIRGDDQNELGNLMVEDGPHV